MTDLLSRVRCDAGPIGQLAVLPTDHYSRSLDVVFKPLLVAEQAATLCCVEKVPNKACSGQITLEISQHAASTECV